MKFELKHKQSHTLINGKFVCVEKRNRMKKIVYANGFIKARKARKVYLEIEHNMIIERLERQSPIRNSLHR